MHTRLTYCCFPCSIQADQVEEWEQSSLARYDTCDSPDTPDVLHCLTAPPNGEWHAKNRRAGDWPRLRAP